MTFRPARSGIANELRALIVRGDVAPGEHLGQHRLAEQFERSKVPVREAFKVLATEGFLRYDHQRGYFVAPLDIEEGRQLCRLCRWIETTLLETAEWPSERMIGQFRAAFDRLDKMDQREDFTAWSMVLAKLRYSLFNLSPQKMLLREAARLWALTDRYLAQMPSDERVSPERTLIAGFEKRDRAALIADFLAARSNVEAGLCQSKCTSL